MRQYSLCREVKWLALCVLLVVPIADAAAQDSRSSDRYIDAEDGQFDLRNYLLKYRGLLPVPIIITEPALGYGAGIAGLWFKESMAEAGARGLAETGRKAPPSTAALGGFKTQNGSWGGFGGYFTPLAGDRYRGR